MDSVFCAVWVSKWWVISDTIADQGHINIYNVLMAKPTAQWWYKRVLHGLFLAHHNSGNKNVLRAYQRRHMYISFVNFTSGKRKCTSINASSVTLVELWMYPDLRPLLRIIHKVRIFTLTLKVVNIWKFTSYCSLKPLWSGMGETVPACTSPTLHPPSPPTVHQLSRLAL